MCTRFRPPGAAPQAARFPPITLRWISAPPAAHLPELLQAALCVESCRRASGRAGVGWSRRVGRRTRMCGSRWRGPSPSVGSRVHLQILRGPWFFRRAWPPSPGGDSGAARPRRRRRRPGRHRGGLGERRSAEADPPAAASLAEAHQGWSRAARSWRTPERRRQIVAMATSRRGQSPAGALWGRPACPKGEVDWTDSRPMDRASLLTCFQPQLPSVNVGAPRLRKASIAQPLTMVVSTRPSGNRGTRPLDRSSGRRWLIFGYLPTNLLAEVPRADSSPNPTNDTPASDHPAKPGTTLENNHLSTKPNHCARQGSCTYNTTCVLRPPEPNQDDGRASTALAPLRDGAWSASVPQSTHTRPQL